MKVIKTLVRSTPAYRFFFEPKTEYALCREFLAVLSGIDISGKLITRVTFSLKDQKEKGYKKVARTCFNHVSIKGKEFAICAAERQFLENAQIKIGDCFWMKAEMA